MRQTLFEIAERFPPRICRLLAHKRGAAPLSHREIASLSGLSKSTVAALSTKSTWAGISIDTVVKFSRACGVNLAAPSKTLDYIRRRKQAHLKKAKGNQAKLVGRLLTLQK